MGKVGKKRGRDSDDEYVPEEDFSGDANDSSLVMKPVKKKRKKKLKKHEKHEKVEKNEEENGEIEFDPKERRLARFRGKCTSKCQDRVRRARRQRLYLVERKMGGKYEESYEVMGSTGNIYTVQVKKCPCCSCPDFKKRQVLKVNESRGYHYQKALLTKELHDIFTNMPRTSASAAVMASKEVREKYSEVKYGTKIKSKDRVNKRSIEGDCPICFDEMKANGREKVDSCHVCGQYTHRDCWNRWKKNSKTCVYCRAPVKVGGKSGSSVTKNEGYSNYSAFQGGMDKNRPTYVNEYAHFYRNRNYGWW